MPVFSIIATSHSHLNQRLQKRPGPTNWQLRTYGTTGKNIERAANLYKGSPGNLDHWLSYAVRIMLEARYYYQNGAKYRAQQFSNRAIYALKRYGSLTKLTNN